ncbi:MAG: alcohol dehydrogenase catalytic domain-containing protein [Gemmatimonadetes bacterium]|nr:alcohol dehydrogenase catalytic domain-containing protein [Gemmatimonadota bacterium]
MLGTPARSPQKAVLTAFGPPEVLQVGEVGTPVAGEHEVLIRVRATTVTFADRLVRDFAAVSPRAFHMPWLFWLISKLSFGFRTPRVRILGSEFSGTVEGVGARVTQFKPGDAVYGFRGARMGAYAEYLCMNERGMLALKPATLTFEEAASLAYGALMAMALLGVGLARTRPWGGRIRRHRSLGRSAGGAARRCHRDRRLRFGRNGVRTRPGSDDGHRLHAGALRRSTREL